MSYVYQGSKMWSRSGLLGLVVFSLALADKFDEDNYGVRYADNCEVCKVVSDEFLMLLSESEGKSEVLETGYSIEKVYLQSVLISQKVSTQVSLLSPK